jgi:membrane-bound serine protease (ClpP class)
MSLIIGGTLAYLYLDPPWRYVVILTLVTLEGFEVMLWLRWRRVRSVTGAESLVGVRARALTDLRPEGQVRVRGQLWKARCSRGAAAGEEVTIERVDGLTLVVVPTERAVPGRPDGRGR